MLVSAALLCHAPIALPAVAGRRADDCAATTSAMRRAARAVVDARPDVVVVVSPHAPRLPDAFGVVVAGAPRRLHADFARFGAPDVAFDLAIDDGVAAEVIAAARARDVRVEEIHAPAELDHGAAVPLAFLVEAGLACPVVVVALPWATSHDPLRRFGRALADVAGARPARRVALVASGDCSHRLIPGAPSGFDPRASEFDRALADAVGRADWDALFAIDPALRARAAEDVVDTLTIAAAATGFPRRDVDVLSYEGPFGVGYLVATLPVVEPAGDRPARAPDDAAPARGHDAPTSSSVVDVARDALRAWAHDEPPSPPARIVADDDAVGAFVTLRDEVTGDLRGCIGRMHLGGRPLPEVVAELAVSAATEDPRFDPVGRDEVDHLKVEVSLLQQPVPVDGVDDLDPKNAGVVVRAGWRQGVLLPDIDGIDDPQTQLRAVLQKARIRPDERYELFRFDARKHS